MLLSTLFQSYCGVVRVSWWELMGTSFVVSWLRHIFRSRVAKVQLLQEIDCGTYLTYY